MDFEKERTEALKAGNAALASLEKAAGKLSGARGWGIYDTFFKGGTLSGLIKHSKMKKAKACILQAQADLSRFGSEMRDLGLEGIDLNTFDLLGIADLFMDGFLPDILMQGRIREARGQVDMAIAQVRALIRRLEGL